MLTRTKTYIRYAKENVREKRERVRDIEREGEMRERLKGYRGRESEMERDRERERVKGRR